MDPMKYIALISLSFTSISCSTFYPKAAPPKMGGQEIPDKNITMDFTQRYDIHWKRGEETGIFRKTKIVGYTGDTVKDFLGSYSKSYSSFGSWLVIEPAGQGRIYLPQGMVSYLQQSPR